MIDYGTVYQRVDSFLQTREGLANPKKAQDYNVFLKELTGIFCGAAFEHDLDTDDVVQYFDMVQDHEIRAIDTSGVLMEVSDLIDTDILTHPLYEITENTLMYYKPSSTQVGPGEFFFCFYDVCSTFGIDNQAGFDIITDGTKTELKKLGSNFTDEALFDGYAESNKVDRLLVIHPVSDAPKPRQRSQYACVPTTEWRKAFYHRGKNGQLALVG